MTHFAGKAAKTLLLAATAVVVMTASAFAAEDEIAVAVGATTGSSLRLREGASTSASIITTLDKGVAVAILDDSEDGWYKIAYNGVTGYVSADYMIVDRDNVFETRGRVTASGVNVRSGATTGSEVVGSVTTGDIVTVNGFADGWFAVTCKSGAKGYVRSDLMVLTSATAAAASSGSATPASAALTGGNGDIVAYAQQYLGVDYVWGGESSSGFDCSGFTMHVYGQFGYSLPHTASGQWKSGIGTRYTSISSLEAGDLVFFNDPKRNNGKACSHVGIYVGGGQFIHASSSKDSVVYSDLTSGYYNKYFKGGIKV